MFPQGMTGNQGDLDTTHQHKSLWSHPMGRFVIRLLMSKEHRNDLAGSRLQFWIMLANVKESFTQCKEYNFRTGAKSSANQLANLCWEEQIIDKICLSGMFS